MFQQINANWFLTIAYAAALDYAQKANLVITEEEFRIYMNLPNATGTGDKTVEGVFNEIQGWTRRYAENQADTALAPVVPFIAGGDYSGVPLVGFIPSSEKFLADLTDYAARNTVALFGVNQFGENPSEEEAIALAKSFIEADSTHVMLAAGITGDAASVEVLADGIGLSLPEVTTEDLQPDAPANEAPTTEEAPESPEVPAEEEAPATNEPVIAAVPDVEEVDAAADLPAIVTPGENLPATHIVVNRSAVQAFVKGQHTIANGLAAMAEGLKQNADAFGQMIGGDEVEVTPSVEVVEEQTV
jgi:hypothetical protein